MKENLAKILEYRWHALLGSFCVVMALLFAYMYLEQYHLGKNKNIRKAAESEQRVLIDLKTGEIISEFADLALIKQKEKEALEKKQDKSKISIIISELAVNGRNTDDAMLFPKNTALAFNPYPQSAMKYSQRADEQGHITIAQLSMNNGGVKGRPIGNLEINENNKPFRNLQNIEATLSKVFSPIAVLMPEDEVLSYTNHIEYTMADIASKNIGVIYMGANQERIKVLANETGANLVIPDVTINDLISESEIRAKFVDLENIAKTNGKALIVLKSFPLNLKLTKEWIDIMPQKNLELAPLRLN